MLLRWELGIGRTTIRTAAALLAVAALPLGAIVSPAAEIGALVLILVAAIGVDARLPAIEQGGAS